MTKQNKKPLQLLFFNADWCGPCKAFKPLVNKALEENRFSDKIEFIDVNIGGKDAERPNEIEQYGIKTVPAIILLKTGTDDYLSLRESTSMDGIIGFLEMGLKDLENPISVPRDML